MVHTVIVQRLRISVDSVAAQLSQHTRGDEEPPRIVLDKDLFSLEDRASELRELFADILLLGPVCRLMGKERVDRPRQLLRGARRYRQRQSEAVRRCAEGHRHGYRAVCRVTAQRLLERHVVVTVERHAAPEVMRHVERIEPVALYPIDAEPLEEFVLRGRRPVFKETQSVAIGKGCRPRDTQRVAPHIFHGPHKLAQSFRCDHCRQVVRAAFEEIMGVAPVERLVEVGLEMIVHPAP